ncbi:MAG TPA: hypothetical protein VIO58_03130 [Candidatus Methanoperedens sp.]
MDVLIDVLIKETIDKTQYLNLKSTHKVNEVFSAEKRIYTEDVCRHFAQV